ncbi:MAG: type II toxin-antitoxin system RelE/ParE family toxin [Elusimicrobia bacterium]|nr:type II toxin-antitoxin system RelE/ParE family toxin [Elusimicrobiota bacterium]
MYQLKVLPSAQRDLDSLDSLLFERIKSKLLELRQDPRPIGIVKLINEEGYRVRIGNYRALYRIDDRNKLIYLYRIKHRKEVYR